MNDFDGSVRFGYLVLHMLMNPLSSSVNLTTSYLKSCLGVQKQQRGELFTAEGVTFDPSKMPLFANKPHFSFLSQSVLTYSLRSDVTNFFRRIWKKDLGKSHQIYSSNGNSNVSTVSYDRKLQLRSKETILGEFVNTELYIYLFFVYELTHTQRDATRRDATRRIQTWFAI